MDGWLSESPAPRIRAPVKEDRDGGELGPPEDGGLPHEYSPSYRSVLEVTGVRYTMGICRVVRSWNLLYKGVLVTKQVQSLSLASASAVLATTAILRLFTCTIAWGSLSRLRYHAGWLGEPRYDAITTYESRSIM